MGKELRLLKNGLIMILAVFAPIKALLITTGVMVFGDLITGVIASAKKGEKITSAGLRRSISKIVVYEVALCFAYLAEHYMTGDSIPMVKMASTLISIVEMKSIYENLNVISGSNLLGDLITKLGSINENK